MRRPTLICSKKANVSSLCKLSLQPGMFEQKNPKNIYQYHSSTVDDAKIKSYMTTAL